MLLGLCVFPGFEPFKSSKMSWMAWQLYIKSGNNKGTHTSEYVRVNLLPQVGIPGRHESIFVFRFSPTTPSRWGTPCSHSSALSTGVDQGLLLGLKVGTEMNHLETQLEGLPDSSGWLLILQRIKSAGAALTYSVCCRPPPPSPDPASAVENSFN